MIGRRLRRRAGFTLIETMAAIGVLSIVLVPTGMLLVTGSGLHREAAGQRAAAFGSQRTADRIVEALEGTRMDSVTTFPQTPLWDDVLDVERVADVTLADGTVTYGTVRIEWVRDPNEADNGLDDDGDQLVDEGRVQMTIDAGTASEQVVLLATGVSEFLEGETGDGSDENGNGLADETGFCIARDGNTLTVRLSLERRTSAGETVSDTAEAHITVRN